jgi:hypothetical protein
VVAACVCDGRAVAGQFLSGRAAVPPSAPAQDGSKAAALWHMSCAALGLPVSTPVRTACDSCDV